MTFVTAGLAVAGAISIAIPILIHLLWRQRRKPVPFAAMRFLIEAFRKHKRRLQIEQLILLIVRCLVLALLGFALARPLLEAGGLLDQGGQRVVYLVIDDGLASGTMDVDAPALTTHKQAAEAILDSLQPGDRVGVITAARPARAMLVPPSTDHNAVRTLIEGLQPRDGATDLGGALEHLRTALDLHTDGDEPIFAYLLSEFRAGSATLDETLPTVLGEVDDRIVLRGAPPADRPATNVSVVSVDPVRRLVLAGATDGSEQVTVHLARHGTDLERAVTKVSIDGAAVNDVPARTVSWQQGQTETTVEFRLDYADQPGLRDLETGITVSIDGDALAPDNQRHAVLSLRRKIRISLVGRRTFGGGPALDRLDGGAWISRALEPSETSPLEVVEVEPAALRGTDLRSSDVAVLARPDLITDEGWTALGEFVATGGLCIVVPPGEVNIHQWTDQLKRDLRVPWTFEREVTRYDAGTVLASEQPTSRFLGLIAGDLNELARPVVVYRALGVDPGEGAATVVLEFANGTPFLVVGRPVGDETAEGNGTPRADGLVAYLAVSPELEWTNLPSKPLMLPLFQELVRQGLSQIRAGRPVFVGERPALATHRAAARLVDPDGVSISMDGTRRPERQLERAGLYAVEDAAGRSVGELAVNIEPAAARTAVQPQSAVGLWLGRAGPWSFYDAEDLGAELRSAETGSPIAIYLIAAVLALILVETMLARWFSHAFRTTGAGGALSGSLAASMSERLAGEGG